MTPAQKTFFDALDASDFSNAAKLFCTLPLHDQESIMQTLATNNITRNAASQKPTVVTLINRQIKDEVSFEQFYQAWQPPKSARSITESQNQFDYFQLPVRVINAANIDNPNQLISIGLIACDDHEHLLEEFVERQKDEQQRAEKIATVADKLGDTELYEILSDDILGS